MSQKVAYVTGGMGGIGTAICQRLHRDGFKVIAGCGPTRDYNKWLGEQKALGYTFYASVGNVGNWESTVEAFTQAKAEHGSVDVLVNNAGIMPLSPLAKLKVDEWDQMIDVNVKGVLYGIAAVLPTMQAQKSGHIINLSSVAGLRVSGGLGTVYSATKFAVKAISEGLRMEVANDNIRVTTLYPGAVASELKFGSSDEQASAAMQAFYEAVEIPADSVARAVAYAIEQPDDVAINEITLRPTRQEF